MASFSHEGIWQTQAGPLKAVEAMRLKLKFTALLLFAAAVWDPYKSGVKGKSGEGPKTATNIVWFLLWQARFA
jgi:hypothetical protein